MIYGHYDAQPPDPLDLWSSDPLFRGRAGGSPVRKRSRGQQRPANRSHVGSPKGSQEKPKPSLHITYLIEGEEEIGSPSFRGFLETHKERLQGDMLLVSDTGSPGPDQLVVTTGLRGLTALEVKVAVRGRICIRVSMGEP